MGLIKRKVRGILTIFVVVCVFAACTVSYKFNGASINYDKVKTISFEKSGTSRFFHSLDRKVAT